MDGFKNAFEELFKVQTPSPIPAASITPDAPGNDGTPPETTTTTTTATPNDEQPEQTDDGKETTVTTSEPNTDVTPTDVTPESDNANPDNTEIAKQNAAFAKLRKENSTYKAEEAALANLLKDNGIPDKATLLTLLKDRQINKFAKDNGISPAIAKELEELRAERNAFRSSQIREQRGTESKELITEMDLTQEEFNAFLQQLSSANIDVETNLTPLKTLYVSMNTEAVVQKAVDKAKRAWETEKNRVNSTTPPPSIPGSPTKTSLDSLDNIANNFEKLYKK